MVLVGVSVAAELLNVSKASALNALVELSGVPANLTPRNINKAIFKE